MSEELSLITSTPVVTLTKGHPYSHRIEVQAQDNEEAVLSLRYKVYTSDQVPTVREKLLVAVLAGVQPQWLTPPTNQPVEGGPPPIHWEGVSAVPYDSDGARGGDHDRLHVGQYTNDGMVRLHVGMKNESGHKQHAIVVLSKGQVTSLLAALLAIYPRLEEN
jgi:hypothetical protein